ncbi:hypothetical protein Cantr_04457 [Candida viswanathii]|uniref:Uncharacterized protein n=1 Tax=Candida viswanathii TaxID=5486 RepID=A0A367XQH3_9ASCO|nr:hypothetical protein Cantr_04457 [Candida viswanathii]
MAGSQPIIPKIDSPIGVFRTSQAVATDITLNVVIYALVYSIIYMFRLRNLLVQIQHYILMITLAMLECFWLIPFIMVRLIYIVYNTRNEAKINDYRYNTHGILRTFVVHNQFWTFKNNLVMNSVFQRGANIFLEIQDDIVIPDVTGGNNDIVIHASEEELSFVTNESDPNNVKHSKTFKKWTRHSRLGSNGSMNIFKSTSRNQSLEQIESRNIASA